MSCRRKDELRNSHDEYVRLYTIQGSAEVIGQGLYLIYYCFWVSLSSYLFVYFDIFCIFSYLFVSFLIFLYSIYFWICSYLFISFIIFYYILLSILIFLIFSYLFVSSLFFCYFSDFSNLFITLFNISDREIEEIKATSLMLGFHSPVITRLPRHVHVYEHFLLIQFLTIHIYIIIILNQFKKRFILCVIISGIQYYIWAMMRKLTIKG